MNGVRVFTDENNDYGDLVPIIVDEYHILSAQDRMSKVKKINVPEIAFINNFQSRDVSIVHSQGEIDFAGTVAIATAWFLSKEIGKDIKSFTTKGCRVMTWQDNDIVWVSVDSSSFPPWNFKELKSPSEIDAIKVSETKDIVHTMYWSWIDEPKGIMRARTFAQDWNILEAEANGSGAMMLAMKLGRKIEMIHGKGSVIFANNALDNKVSLGGRVFDQDKFYKVKQNA